MKKGVIAAMLLCFLLSLGMAFSQNNDINDKVDKEIEDLLKQNNEVSVIVVLQDDPNVLTEQYSASQLNKMDDSKKEKMMIAEQQQEVLERLDLNYDFELKNKFSSVNGFSGEVTKQGLEKLINDPNVKKIHPNRPVKAFLSDSVNIVNATNTWRLIYNLTNLTGKKEVVCVIDTGVNYTHSDMGNCAATSNINDGSCTKVIGGYDFINNDENPIDDNGHGTHVAGIVASTNETYRGVASDANIVAIKVLDSGGGGNEDDLISGINWCVNNASVFNITVISMSLGVLGYKNTTYCDTSDNPLLVDSIHNAISKNISVIVAAGNDGNSPLGVGSPACISNVTVVGSTTKSGSISPFSDLWSLPMLLAPGSDITSLRANGADTTDCSVVDSNMMTCSGTSMSTPMVAAAFALIHQYFKLTENKAVMPNETERYLNNTGKLIVDSGGNNLQFSRINIFAALLALDTTAPEITFVNPTLANKSNSTNATFFINITSNEVLINATLEFNGTNETMEGSALNWFKNKTLDSGAYLYKVLGSDSAGNTGLSELRLIQINNTAPNIDSFFPSTLVFSMNEPDNQTFNITYNDMDGDAVKISWYKNSTLVSASNEFNFTGNFTSAGFYNITVFVADDGDKAMLTWNFTINNTNQIPIIETVILNSTDFLNRTNGTLLGFFTTSDSESDIITTNETKWYNNTEEVLELANYISVTSNYTKKYQNWTFSVRVFDGLNFSEWVNSSNLTIRNSAPAINITIQDITINESGLVDINLSGNLGATDNDNDTLTFSYSAPLNSSGQWRTSFTDARNYTITINVSDGDNGLDTQNIILEVLDKVNGANDTITGNITDIITNAQDLQLRINNTLFNSSKAILGLQEINFTDGNLTLAVFDFNFSNTTKFNFVNIKINRTKTNGAESLVIKGIDLTSQGKKKTLYLNRTNATFNSVCVKDSEINSIGDISSDCSDETKLACDGIATSGFICTLEGTVYKITGLSHSGIKQISYTRPSDSSNGNGGGGGGGSSGGGGGAGLFYICNMDWSCTAWSECENGWQTRECNFVKVPQHTQREQCPSMQNIPKMAERCQVSAEARLKTKTAEKVADETEEAEASAPLITGAAVAGTEKAGNIFVGVTIITIIIVVGILVYALFFSIKK